MQRSKGGMQGRGVKIKQSLPAVKPPPGKSATEKPLAGRVFYLDIPSKLLSEKLEKDIKDLGGTIEGFLSKEISCLITSKKEAKCARSLNHSSSIPSPEPIKNAGNVIARPASRRDGNQERDSNKKPEKDDVSRGKSLLKKVIKEQEILPKNSILANALNWGVRILHVEEAKIYIEQKKKSLQLVKEPETSTKAVVKQPARRKPKAQKLKGPYIKVEDSSCLYRPLYLVLPLFRSFQSPASKSCQSVDKKAATANKVPETKQGLNKTWHGQDGGNNSNCKAREQKKRGYCECCLQKYDDLEAHLVGQQHKNFSQGPYYQDVDNLISMFEFDFVDWSRCRHEAKSSVLLTPVENIKQEEVEIPEAPHPISSQISQVVNQQPVNVLQTELESPHAADGHLSNNPDPEPVESTPYPVQSLLNQPCSPYSIDIPPGSPILIPETPMTPVPAGETFSYEDKQEDTLNPEGMPQGVMIDPSFKSPPHQTPSSEPETACPSKKIKLDDSLVSETLLCNSVVADRLIGPAPAIETVHEDVEMVCNSNPPDALLGQSPPSSPSKPHRMVKTLPHRERRPETPQTTPVCKVSVPVEQYDLNSPTEALLELFESSKCESEFCGFSCNSEVRSHTTDSREDQPASQGSLLWCLFSQTSSSAATFYGF